MATDARNYRILVAIALTAILVLVYLRQQHFGNIFRSMSVKVNASLEVRNNVCSKGEPQLSKEFILAELQPFLTVYNRRPEVVNVWGTGIHHQFALWCFIKKLQPLHVIESGVHRGYGTWLIRQAAPHAQLILLDPTSRSQQYRDKKADTVYMTDTKFRDFRYIDWKNFSLDAKRTLVFFDDHKHAIYRVLESHKAGFAHLIFDDNFDAKDKRVDNFSLKLACQLLLNRTRPGMTIRSVFRDPPLTVNQEEMNNAHIIFNDLVDGYFEFPRIWKDAKSATRNYLLEAENIQDALKGYSLDKLPTKHNQQYVNICYVKLNNA